MTGDNPGNRESADARRLFVALPVAPNACNTLAALPRQGLNAAWLDRDELHITLRFLGSVAAAQVPDIEQALARVRRPTFSLDIDGLGLFDADRPAVLFARVASTRKATALCAEITDALTPLGFDFGTRPFVPHITLARVRAGDAAGYVRRTPCRAHWQATGFALLASGSKDLRVDPIRRFALEAP